MKKLNHVLTGVDFSPASDNALREAARIVSWDQAKLTAIHVLDQHVLDHLSDKIPGVENEIYAEAEGRLKHHVGSVMGEGSGVETRFVIGDPFREVMYECERRGVELVVVGSAGRDSASDRVGPLATRCIRKVPANVLLVRERQVGSFRKVVACIDFSENAAKAAAQAVHIAQQDESLLEFLHVHAPVGQLVGGVGYFTAVVPRLDTEDLDGQTSERLEKELAEFVDPIVQEAGGYPYKTTVLSHANFRKAIMDYLEETRADLVVLGTRGKSSLRNLLLGATAEKIIHHAPCSVLAIKPDGFNYQLD